MADEITIDNYELTNCIATGNATQIWEVKEMGTSQQFAMKLLLDEAFKNNDEKKALKAEFNLAKTFEHPNIITMVDLTVTRDHGYFIMEHFRAGNLKSMIRHEHAGAKSRCKRMLECLTQALSVVHRKGYVHRDIKPENILVNKAGEVRLIDFSLSSKPSNAFARAITKKSNISIQGTRTYLAPELIKREALTFSADMYSLGVVMFETLVGHPPFRNGNPNELLMMHVRDQVPPPVEYDENITPELNQLVLKMLSKKPKDRPQSMDELFATINNMPFFKIDPLQYHKDQTAAKLASNAQVEEDRFNSRLDAERTAAGIKPPEKRKPKPVVVPKELIKKENKPAAPATPPAQPMPMQPGMPMQGYPGMPMPGYPQPGMPMQGYQMPGMPMQGYPGMPMPGYPQPGMPMQPGMNFPMPQQGYPQPGFPQQGFPQQGFPQQGFPQQGFPQQGFPQQGGYPQPGMPASGIPQAPAAPAPKPAQPTTATPAPAAPTPDQKKEKPLTDIPLATLDDLEIQFE